MNAASVGHKRARSNTDKRFMCDVAGCDKAFKTKQKLQTHKRTHTGEKPFKCDVAGCDYACTQSTHLVTHKRTHTGEKPYKCDVAGCDFACTQSGWLETHKRTHTGEKPFKCDVAGCDFACAKSGGLATHKRTHTGEKPYKCDFISCDFACTTSGGLVTHKRMHTGEKPFKCDVVGCDYACSESGSLVTHKRTHTGAKPFKCDVVGCDFACAGSGGLVTHKRTHTGEKPYVCDVCPIEVALVFARSHHLKAHKKRWHTPEGAYKAIRKQQALAKTLEDAGFDFRHELTIDTSCSAEANATASVSEGRESKSRRVDMVRIHQVTAKGVIISAIIFIECDEFQHDDRDTSCEVARMTQVNEALALEGNTLPIVWIRWNPDACRMNGVKCRIPQKERGALLVRFLHALTSSSVALLPGSVSIFYLFYDRDDGVGHGFVPPKFALAPEYASFCTLIKDPAPFLPESLQLEL
jgi:hypothetical protein